MLGNMACGLLVICLFSLLLCLGCLVRWTIMELPRRIREALEFRRWRKVHSRIFF